MKKIASFTVNHLKLLPGLYVSRKDVCSGVTVTTFDLRFTAPNKEPVVDVPALHTVEHLGATFLRNCPQKKQRGVLRPHGMSHGVLPCDVRRFAKRRRVPAGSGNVPFYCVF